MKVMKVMVFLMAISVSFSLAIGEEAKKAKTGIVIPTDKNVEVFAQRYGVTVEDLVKWNPQLTNERPGGPDRNLKPYQLMVGESLYIEDPQKGNSSPMSSDGPAREEIQVAKEINPHLGLSIGIGNSNRSDYIFIGLYPEIPFKEWFGIILGFSEFRSTDRDYLAENDTFRYDSGVFFRTKNFISETKFGQDYVSGQGLSGGVNLTQSFQFGFWRLWNESIGFTNTNDWPFWARNRLRFTIFRGESILSLGCEYTAFGWKNKDPNLPEKGYYYSLRLGGFLMYEISGAHHISILLGGGSSDLEAIGKGGEKKRYYLVSEFNFRLF